jgi:hypothetical protein
VDGPWHYQEAERLIASTIKEGDLVGTPPPHVIALAQVHATLAVAAATVDAGTPPGGGHRAWHDVQGG